MPFTEKFDDEALLFECVIRLTTLNSEQDLAQALDDYANALDRIAKCMHDNSIYFFAITILMKKGLVQVQSTGTSLQSARILAKDRNAWGERNAWKCLCPEFWIVAWQFPALRLKIIDILNKLEIMMKELTSGCRSTSSLWEDEQTQFCEPLISLLAIQDRNFVDRYRQFMNLWDMDHEFQQSEIINVIVHTHGINVETERLLLDRCTCSSGQDGEAQIEELYGLLQMSYGNFTQSRLFEQIVAYHHDLDMKERQDALNEYERIKMEHPNAKPRARNEPPFNYSNNAELKTAAKDIFSRLDALHPLSHFL